MHSLKGIQRHTSACFPKNKSEPEEINQIYHSKLRSTYTYKETHICEKPTRPELNPRILKQEITKAYLKHNRNDIHIITTT